MPSLLLRGEQGNDQSFPLHEGANTIGRAETNDVAVLHRSLSRQHARLWISGPTATVEDLESTNGTLVDGVPIKQRELTGRHAIRCGDVEFVFVSGEDTASAPVQPSLIYDIEKNPFRQSLKELLASRGVTGNQADQRQPDQEKRSREMLQILLKVGELLSSPTATEALVDRILELAFDILPIDRGVLLLLDDRGVLSPRATRVRPGLEETIGFSRHIVDYVMAKETAALFADAQSDPRVPQAESIVAQSICTSMCVPMKPRDKLIGALYVDSLRAGVSLEPVDLEFLAAFANQAAIAIDHARLGMCLADATQQRRNLQRFFPSSTVDLLVRGDAALSPVETLATVLFSDISGYTEISSKMSPIDVIGLLNTYFSPMADIVFHHEGTLEKYIGDALLALWGAPVSHEDDAARAVRAAVDMQVTLRRLVAEGSLPSFLQVHIGIKTGRVAAGSIGSDAYMQYATVGDATNVASRICGVAKGGEIVIDEDTAQMVASSWAVESMGAIPLRGKISPAPLFRVKWK